MAMRQEVNAPLILTVGVVSGVLLVILMLGTHAWFLFEEQTEVRVKSEQVTPMSLQNLIHEQRTNLAAYRWANAEKTVVQIPIEDAMKQIVQTGGKLPATRPTTRPATRPTTAAAK